ncbi:MAG TPA: SAM-dependent methyltransferase [Euzebyales bacterium]|nr:SAM-dependent methyltransferase [Euzebyales bacterium]
MTFEDADFAYGGPRWKPDDIDPERPSPARVYDYLLDGAHNFDVDRKMAEQLLIAHPGARTAIQTNRAFLRRAVEFMVGAGIRQFLDIGSGIPTVGHVHDIAQGAAPESRVVFVDIDPIAVAHSRDILRGNDRTAVIQEDVRRAEAITDHPDVRGLLDYAQPVGMLLVALFHFIPDADDPARIVSRLTAPLASGSYVAISHLTGDGTYDIDEFREVSRRSGIDVAIRNRRAVEALGGLELVEPGLVWAPQWRPESPNDLYLDEPSSPGVYAGVGRKP